MKEPFWVGLREKCWKPSFSQRGYNMIQFNLFIEILKSQRPTRYNPYIHIYIYISICYAILSRRPEKVRQNAASRSWQQVSPCHGVSMCFVHDPCLKFQGLNLSIKVAFHEFNDVGRRGVCVSGVSLDLPICGAKLVVQCLCHANLLQHKERFWTEIRF